MSQAIQFGADQMNHQILQRILIVDDEPDINMIAKISLESFGKYNVETCSSGVEALKKAEWFEPNLILLDVMMPFMDGEETIRKLKRNPKTANIPVIFVTARIFKKDILKYKELGALDVIPKPFDPIGLPNLIKEIWNGFNSRQEAEKEITEKLVEMQAAFMEGLPERLTDLRTQWATYLESEHPLSLMDVYSTIHKITGVSGTLGLDPVYKIAARIEKILLTSIEDNGSRLTIHETKEVFDLISELGRLVAKNRD